MMPNRKPLIEKLEQLSPLNFRVDCWEGIVIACIPADIFEVGKSLPGNMFRKNVQLKRSRSWRFVNLELEFR